MEFEAPEKEVTIKIEEPFEVTMRISTRPKEFEGRIFFKYHLFRAKKVNPFFFSSADPWCHAKFCADVLWFCPLDCPHCYKEWKIRRSGRIEKEIIHSIKKKCSELGKPLVAPLALGLVVNLPDAIRSINTPTLIRINAMSDVCIREGVKFLRHVLMAAEENPNVYLIIMTKTPLQKEPGVMKEMAELAAEKRVFLHVSLPTFADEILSIIEPVAFSAKARINLISTAISMGIPTAVRIYPLIPGLNDSAEHFRMMMDYLEKHAAIPDHVVVGYIALPTPEKKYLPSDLEIYFMRLRKYLDFIVELAVKYGFAVNRELLEGWKKLFEAARAVDIDGKSHCISGSGVVEYQGKNVETKYYIMMPKEEYRMKKYEELKNELLRLSEELAKKISFGICGEPNINLKMLQGSPDCSGWLGLSFMRRVPDEKIPEWMKKSLLYKLLTQQA